MRNFFCVILVLLLTIGASAAAPSEEEYLSRAIAASYPDVSYGARVAIAAVVINRTQAAGYPDSVGGAVMSLAAEGEFGGIDKSASEIDGKLLRTSRDAVRTAMVGADPTGGALNFESPNLKEKPDLRFDDSAEDVAARAMRSYFREKRGAEATVIDGIGFY